MGSAGNGGSGDKASAGRLRRAFRSRPTRLGSTANLFKGDSMTARFLALVALGLMLSGCAAFKTTYGTLPNGDRCVEHAGLGFGVWAAAAPCESPGPNAKPQNTRG